MPVVLDVVRKAHVAAEQMHLETVLHRNVNELSYGQKRQLEVAIALCAEPKILLMGRAGCRNVTG